MKKSYKLLGIATVLITAIILCSIAVIPTSAETQYITYRAGGNDVSSYYKGSKFYKQLTSVPYTGDNATDVVAVALSQLGYIEGASSSELAGTYSSGNADFCEMNYNSGSQYGYGYYWQASFVSFCLFQSRATDHGTYDTMCRNHYDDPDYIWKEISCTAWIRNLKVAKAFQWSKYFGGSYTPKTGDIIFYTWAANTSSGADHTGVVAYNDGTYVYTIEGNTGPSSGLEDNGDGVYFKQYALDSKFIYGYGTPPYKSENLKARIDYSGKNPSPGTYVNASGFKCYIYSDKECTVDSGVTLSAYDQFDVISVEEKYTSGDALSLLKIDYNGTVGYIKDKKSIRLIQIAKDEEIFIPEKPEIKTFSNNSITLESGGAGYEYKMDNGAWQTSNVFTGLSSDKTYNFYQRYVGYEEVSPALSVNIQSLMNGIQLKSITVDGYNLNPSFSPNTNAYSVRVPESLGVPNITVLPQVLTTQVYIDVDNQKIENNTATANITLHSKDGYSGSYSITFLFVSDREFFPPAAPTIKNFTNSSITLNAVDGCEYKVDDGEWQTTKIFNNLSAGKTYNFYQRYIGYTPVSSALSIDLKELISTRQLKSLTVGEYDLMPEFSPNLKVYSVNVPDTLTEVPNVIAVPQSSTTEVEIDIGNIINNTATVNITLYPEIGQSVTYSIAVSFVSESDLVPPVETDKPEENYKPAETDKPTEENSQDQVLLPDLADKLLSGCTSSTAALAVSGVVGLVALFTLAGKKKEE